MADERYEWLDRDAAERLLRGVPVEAVGEPARTDAARLAAALEHAADPGYRYDDGELPGEAAAMAAYRKARADAAVSGVAAGSSAGASLGTVRVAGAARPARSGPLGRLRRGPGLARPFRFGIATALAGCAIGGVAVAAGTGVLPTFGDDRPTPASSVSAAATPGPVTPPTQGGAATGGPSGSPDEAGTPPVVPPAPDTSTSPPPGGTGGSTAGLPAEDGGTTAGPGDSAGGAGTGEVYRKTVEACRDYRSGRIAPDTKRRLEEAAKGSARVERFCDELLDGGSGDGSTGSGDSSGAGGTGSGGSDGAGGTGSGGRNSGGSTGSTDRSGHGDGDSGGDADSSELRRADENPSVSWTLTPEPTAAVPQPAPTLSVQPS
ncbi:hypothetical protein [Streptomyces sp. NPDC006274]|uniref:hypothetical protein n=1 Tax=unclassified Streptomyces TaxID=2593676 RepID=UPI0033BE26CB